MRAYGLPRRPEIEFPDCGDALHFGLSPIAGGNLPGPGGERVLMSRPIRTCPHCRKSFSGGAYFGHLRRQHPGSPFYPDTIENTLSTEALPVTLKKLDLMWAKMAPKGLPLLDWLALRDQQISERRDQALPGYEAQEAEAERRAFESSGVCPTAWHLRDNPPVGSAECGVDEEAMKVAMGEDRNEEKAYRQALLPSDGEPSDHWKGCGPDAQDCTLAAGGMRSFLFASGESSSVSADEDKEPEMASVESFVQELLDDDRAEFLPAELVRLSKRLGRSKDEVKAELTWGYGLKMKAVR